MSDWFTDEDVAEAVRAAVNAGRDNKTLIECVVAALSAVNPFEWRPIETAPKGEPVLVFVPDASAPQIIIAGFFEFVDDPDPGDWYPSWDQEGNGSPIDAEVTHWMPLPLPPEGK